MLEILGNLNIPEAEVERLEKVPVPQFIWAVNKAAKALAKAKGKQRGLGPQAQLPTTPAIPWRAISALRP